MPMQYKLSKEKVFVGSYAEEGQAIPIIYSFADVFGKTAYMLHTPIKCRDFLLDTILWQTAGKKNGTQSVHGFKFSERNPDKYMLILQKCPFIEENLAILNRVEVENGFEPSTVHDLGGGSYLLLGDNKLQSKTELLSMHTLLMRFLSHKKQTMDSLESMLKGYLGTKARKAMKYILENVKGVTNNKDALEAIKVGQVGGAYHATIGIQYFCNTLKYNQPNEFAKL